MIRQAHLRHDRRDAILTGIGLVLGAMFVGLIVIPFGIVEPLVDTLGPYRATLVGSLIVGAVIYGVMRWLGR